MSTAHNPAPLVMASAVAAFSNIGDTQGRLAEAGYISDPHIAGVVSLAAQLGKPLLAEGPAGTGKTELAKAIARSLNARLIRLQCYEGLDESRALYEWDYRKQLLRIQAARQEAAGDWNAIEEDIFGEEYLLHRPLLEAIQAEDDVVLLIDEVDRLDIETEALLLEILSDFQVSIPELGTVHAKQLPLVVLTSNNSRDLSEALKRRCLFMHVGYPTVEREREIILAAVPGITENLAEQVARIVRTLRDLNLKKSPSVSETLDWARALVLQGKTEVTTDVVIEHLSVLLTHQTDIEKATEELTSS